MGKATIATTLLIAGGMLGLASSISSADEQGGLSIADNDSVYVDGKSFQMIPGKAKGDAAVQIKALSARELGPAAIIMRSGNRLYIADAQSQTASPVQVAAAVPSYAYDPRAYNPRLLGGGSAGYNYNVATDYAYDPRAYNPRLLGGGTDAPPLLGGGSVGYNYQVATDYAYDPRMSNPRLLGGGSSGYNYNVATDYAYDPRLYNPRLLGGGSSGYNYNVATDYAYDPRVYDPRLLGGGSSGYNYNVATSYAYDPRAYPIRDPNPWAHDYAYDPNFMPQRSVIYDPDYVAYRLRKAFAENWTPSAAAMGDSH